ncbi:hypothetical protein [Amycolatopsis benzoatilytica]|uniref:hypothetical protein n=1 Tax=Amycolatopsis benzoatilytica TaxID=346045 RepID=UPI000372D2F3|nr:hypothetical protein [Amycolatopsis benzoatilytica]
MRITGKILGAGALLLIVTACGGGATSGAGSPSSSSAPSSGTASTPVSVPSSVSVAPPPSGAPPKSQPTQSVPPGDTALAPGQLDASALPDGYPHDVSLANGGTVVVIQAEEAGCNKLSAKAGEQTPSQVVILVTVAKPPRGQMCPFHVREVTLTVPLSAPLGARKLVLRPGP